MRACAAILAAAALLAGCGGNGDGAPAKSAPASTPKASTPAESAPLGATPDSSGGAKPRPGAVQVAALGDSITAGSPLWDRDPEVRAAIADRLNDQSQYGYWAERALGGRVKIRNCGVFGERTDQIALRLADCARNAKVIVIEGGINDIAQGGTPEAAATNLERMVRQARRAKLVPILTEVLPWTGGYPKEVPKIVRANELIRAIARRNDVPVAPWYDALNDRGRMKAGLGIDDSHPSVAGYRRIGDIIAPLIERAIAPDA